MLTLSPMTEAPVCRVGDPLQLTCTAPVQSLRWSIFQVNDQGTLADVINSVLIESSDNNQMKQREMDSTTFIFTRISTLGVSPLITTLSIDSVNIGLNETVVHCTDVANPMTSASTTISIISDANSTQPVTLSKLQPIKPILSFSINRSVHSIHGCYIGSV